MIVEALFKLVMGLITSFFSLIPTINLNITLPDTTYFRQLIGAISWIFPIGTFLQAIAVWFVFQNLQFVLKMFNFVWKKIPFLG